MQGKITIELESIGDAIAMTVSTNVTIDSAVDDCVSKICIIRELMRSMHFTVLETELLKVGLVNNVWPDNTVFTPVDEPELDRALKEAIMKEDENGESIGRNIN